MKLKFIFFVLVILFSKILFAQNTIKITNNYGSENQEIQDLIDFENIYIEQLNLESENIKGKSYQINLEEYVNGKLSKTSMLFDGTETDYFKIDSEKESIKFFFKIAF